VAVNIYRYCTLIRSNTIKFGQSLKCTKRQLLKKILLSKMINCTTLLRIKDIKLQT